MKFLFLDIDTLRPDHMGCYGYGRNTTPNIDRMAEEAVRFDRYYCSDAPCLPSRAALTTGLFGIKNGIVGHGGTAADRFLTGCCRGMRDQMDTGNFVNIFRKAGMYTASISTFAERHSAYWFDANYNECFNEGHWGLESGEAVLPYALKWLRENGTQRENWFLHVHFWDPHTPYRAPEAFGNPFAEDVLEDLWITDEILEQHIKAPGPHTARDLNMYDDKEHPKLPRNPGKIVDRAGLKRVFDGYDCGIAYMDSLVGQIFDELKALGIYEETAIVLTSDHGENFGELGVYAEHGTADEACCHIPFLVKWPGAKAGHVDKGLHYSLDFLPTACDLMNVPKSEYWDGRSFAPAMMDGQECGRESLVVSQNAHVCQRSAIFGDWLYMRTYHDGYHLYDREMLFNLKEDIHETNNLRDQYPEICAQGAKIILDWHDDAMMTSTQTVDPMWTVMKENGPYHAQTNIQKYFARLEATGRAEGAAILRERHHISAEQQTEEAKEASTGLDLI